jgi:hypothetical protein
MRRSGPRRALALLLAVAAAGGVAWAGAVYVRLIRLRVGLVEARGRAEAAARARVALAANLVQGAEDLAGAGPEETSALRRAMTEALGNEAGGDLLLDAEAYGRFRRAQEELDESIERFWATLNASPRGRWLVLDLAGPLTVAGDRLRDALRGVELRAAAYAEASARLPGSVVAGIASLSIPQAAATPARPPGRGPDRRL